MWKWRIREISKQLLQIIWYIAPNIIKEEISHMHTEKLAKRNKEIFSKHKVSAEEVEMALRELDITGDVMIHASLVEIGNVKGAHLPFVKHLENQVLDKGNTLLAIAIPLKGNSEGYLRGISTFDSSAPIAMGRISSYYARHSEACRSLNPTHSVVAVGLRAKEYTEEHHLDKTPFGEHSPYYKLLQHNGSILMIGASLKYMTIGHIIEDMLGDNFPYNVYTKKTHRVDVYRDGICIHKGEYFTHSSWRGAFRVADYVLYKIRQISSMRSVKLGASEILYFNAREAIICELEELRRGNSIYGYCRVDPQTKKVIGDWIERIKNMTNG